MLSFFRKYQRYFFVAITIVIVISFSFFGTYSTLQAPQIQNQVAFKAVDGSEVLQPEVDEMVLFLSMDPDEKFDNRDGRPPAFVNDAVFRKEIINTGLGELIATAYPDEIEEDLLSRQNKEMTYQLYIHPEAPFISMENAWSAFSPSMKNNYLALKQANNPTSSEAIAARMRLYLEAKQFSPAMLRQVFKYQERQYSWLQPDENLDKLDLSLFGYHSAEDWFGPRFMRLSAEFIINSAKIAQQRGYQVSKAEAAADLHHNAGLAFNKVLQDNRYLAGVTSSDEYLTDQLRRYGLDENQAVKSWRNIMLFRRLFQDAGNSVFVDKLPFKTFDNYAEETAEGQIYQLPEELHLANFNQLQKFEIYLSAISKQKRKDLLPLPTEFLSVADMMDKRPELVDKKYLLEVAMIDLQSLNSKVGLRETWSWEVDSKNWTLLTKEFPELGIKNADSQEARYAALDALDSARRSAVDAFARKAIVAAHPEWIKASLREKAPQTKIVTIAYEGEETDIKGLTHGFELITLLDKAHPQDFLQKADEDAVEKLSVYTADGKHYYAIKVRESLPNAEIMTFAEANQRGVLDKLLTKELEQFYASQKDSQVTSFQTADKSWKPFADVKDELAKKYFIDILTAIKTSQKNSNDISDSAAATMRLMPYVEGIQKAVQGNSFESERYVSKIKADVSNTELKASKGLQEQWKLKAKPLDIARKDSNENLDASLALSMTDGAWSKVQTASNGSIYFYQKLATKNVEGQNDILKSVENTRDLFSNAVQKALGQHLLDLYKQNNAISLEYLNNAPQMTNEE